MAVSSSPLVFPPFRLELETGTLWHDQQQRQLRPQVVALFHYLFTRAGLVVTKAELLAALWPGTTVSDGLLKTCIWEIRQALRESQAEPRFIETIPRRGYRFIGKVVSSQQSVVRQTEVASSQYSVFSSLPPPSQSSVLSPLSSVLVGRETELTELKRRLDKALAGERQIVCVTGEAGIGKTSLVDTFVRQAGADPKLWIARGQCIERYGTSEAYLPILDALGRLGREPGRKRLTYVLRKYAPTWLVQLPALIDTDECGLLQRSLQHVTHQRMLREVADALAVLTAEQPLVLVLEDLHWSDPSTLDLLSLLARQHDRAQLLIIGTYRPVDILGNGHPLRAFVQELSAHQLCNELRVAPLSHAAVEAYLTRQFSHGEKDLEPSAVSLRELTRALHQRTEGNPLFMVNAVDYLLAQGAITQVDGQWDLSRAVANVQHGVPPNIQQLIERQIDQISPEDQRILEVASVAGEEFSAAAVAAGLAVAAEEIERQGAELTRRTLFLQPTGIAEWPDGTVATRYGFRHALYQQVLYERIPTGRRIALHQRIGERIEQGYDKQTREVATELALHFERGRNFSQAIHYLRQAGENATRRSAHSEAVSLFTKGLELLQLLPHTAERTQQEIRLHLALGAPLITLKGYASPEVESAYTRAYELCQQIGETRYQFPSVLGLCGVRHNQAEFRKAHVLAQQLLHLAHTEGEPTRLLWAHVFSGTILYLTGKFVIAQKDFEEGITLYNAPRHSPRASDVIQDPGVHCRCYLAEILWLRGYANQARQLCHQALTLARQSAHSHSEAVALSSATFLHNWLGEQQTALGFAEELITLTHEHGFPQWFAVGTFLRGWTLAQQGWAVEGVSQMRQGLAAFQTTDAKQWLPFFSCQLAWAYGRAGQPSEGLTLLAEAQAMMDHTEERYYEAELYRLYGKLSLRAGEKAKRRKGEEFNVAPSPGLPVVLSSPEACFLKAIDIARQQQARSWELRATMSLARLWQQQGKQNEAHNLLSAIYDWFTEGFETADVQAAKALLTELE